MKHMQVKLDDHILIIQVSIDYNKKDADKTQNYTNMNFKTSKQLGIANGQYGQVLTRKIGINKGPI